MDVHISPLGLVARLVLESGEAIETREIERMLKKTGVVFGIDHEAIKTLETSKARQSVVVAKGLRPIGDERPVAHYLFSLTQIDPQPREVKAGEVIARTILGMTGRPGTSVWGASIPGRRTLHNPLLVGRNCRVEGNSIVATIDGIPHVKAGRVWIHPVKRISPALDTTRTQVNFDGDVVVEGNVPNGWRIKATGNILVTGRVDAGCLSAGGDVTVKAGIRQQSMVKAWGTITCRFAEHSILEANGTIFVEEDLGFCVVETAGEVRVTGRILGGRIAADCGVYARALGARAGIKTEVALEPASRRKARLEESEAKLAKVKTGLDLVRKGLQTVGLNNASPIEDMPTELKLQALESHLLREVSDVLREVLVGRQAVGALPTPRIHVQQAIFAGVEVVINGAYLQARGQMPSGRLIERGGRILTLAG